MSSKKSDVSIVIPNWNGRALLEKNLPAVFSSIGYQEIVIVDDASTDGSVDFLKHAFPSVVVIHHNNHLGYASAVNTGVAHASGRIVVLINTDVVPEKNFLRPLVSHFDNPNIFAVGCLDSSVEGEKIVLRGRGIASWKRGYFIHSRGEIGKSDTAWVSGGSGAFKKNVWVELGGLDPLFNPFYWEDIDLSYRARKAGYKLIFEEKSIVRHVHSEGSIKKNYSQFFVNVIAYRNQFTFTWKNLSDPSIWIEHCAWTPVRLLQALFRGDVAMLVGYFWSLFRLPKILVSRSKGKRLWKLLDKDISTGEDPTSQ